jgi:MFS superfamily sulfate permease-like transporter
LLRGASRPRIATLGRVSGTDRFADLTRYTDALTIPHALVLRIESGLFYFNAENVKERVLSMIRRPDPVQLVVLDLSTSANIDLAGVRMLRELCEELSHAGVKLGIAEVHGAVRDLATAEELHKEVPGVEQRLTVSALIQQWQLKGAAV